MTRLKKTYKFYIAIFSCLILSILLVKNCNASTLQTAKNNKSSVHTKEIVMTTFNPDNALSYCNQPVCQYDKETGLLDFTINFKSIPDSDDLYVYLFEVANYEDDESFDGKPYVSSVVKDKSITMSFPYKTRYLFSRFVPVIAYNKTFYPISIGQYITNPEDVSENNTTYPEISSKKGKLLDPDTIDKKELNDLNVRRIAYR